MAQDSGKQPPIVIETQGSFAVGGTVLRTPGIYDNKKPTVAGQSFHGDHLYAFYQVPQKAKALPIVMLHGAFQSARSWETTPAGREGFQTFFLRRGFPVYLVDQPRRGRAGNSNFDGVQFDRKPETLNQFFRSVTPNTGPYDAGVIADAMSALFTRIGPGILFTHSQAGGPGWLTAIRNQNVRAIVALEPGSGFVFPRGELAYLAEVCAFLGDEARAEVLYELLEPYRDMTIIAGVMTVCLGSAGRYLGLLATALAAWERAEEHFEAALQVNGSMGALPWLAHTQWDYARMLRRRGRVADLERSEVLLSEAWTTANRLDMVALKTRLRGQQH